MHLLAVQPGDISDGSEAVDLGQTAGDIVVLSAADSDLASLVAARKTLGADFPELRLANFLQLQHNLSVDLYVENVIETARFVCIRLLGGSRYWPYGLSEIRRVCAERGIPLAVVPGDDKPDSELAAWSSVKGESYMRLWSYLAYGGVANAANFLRYLRSQIDPSGENDWQEPVPLLNAGLYWPGLDRPSMNDIRARWKEEAPVALVTFYRSLVQSGATQPVDMLVEALRGHGLNPLPVFVQSLKDPFCETLLEELMGEVKPSVALNLTSFAVSVPGRQRRASVLEKANCPVLQVILSSQNETKWREGLSGLSARDIAMNVSLPEVDGRIVTRAIGFKAEMEFDPTAQCPVVGYSCIEDRVTFVAALAEGWTRLAATSAAEKKVAVVLANYPNRDGRIGNGVGLDTPQSTLVMLRHMKAQGYVIDALPDDGNALMKALIAGPTNALTDRESRKGGVGLDLRTYRHFFKTLPGKLREEVIARWGMPEDDPFVSGREDRKEFRLPAIEYGNVVVGIQPARGYNIDPKSTYHDPALVPPHSYFAFYCWLREVFGAHAVIHMGKHGTMEWLPGKSIALSETCFPDAVFGPLPHLYPFIVNDPGEGTQAKRRAQAVIIDHMTPPLTRAEIYGPLRNLEALVDEYYEAANVDPRRMDLLRKEILDLARSAGLDRDCGFDDGTAEDDALSKLDNYLCELKEMQIRDGLHVFGRSPVGRLKTDTLVALTRTPREAGQGENASLLRALATDLDLGPFDPLDCNLGDPYEGPTPNLLRSRGESVWRSNGDTLERLEALAAELVSGEEVCPAEWPATAQVLRGIETTIAPDLAACGEAELDAVIIGLDGRFVMPGPSGAPTRGRPEVLPTGRNFYSVDSRAVPTQTAWTLGWRSAQLLVEDYRQRHGRWPEAMAISAWGTSNMRTGGDDIAQALALIGVRPQWDLSSGRVTGFEILPVAKLGHPRVDVTFRISGFFRDAFPAQTDLLSSAFRAVMQLDEDEADNPLAARYAREVNENVASGVDRADAEKEAGFRVFGSKPGAYGAGLQVLMDEGVWGSKADIAEAYLTWGSYAYGEGANGVNARRYFEKRLGGVDAIVQNQDNREHDLLDSDDYYQFEGGMAAAVTELKGAEPVLYHNDHSRPETPKVRTLADEIGRVVRARAANPKWIAAAMRHGYKGAYEMAATVDYLFAFAASTSAVADHHFDLVFDAYLGDEAVRGFLQENNPDAMREIADRFDEAIRRELWRPQRNSVAATLDTLSTQRSV